MSAVQEPVTRLDLGNGQAAWLAVGYDAVRQVLVDPSFSVAAPTSIDAPRLAEVPPNPDLVLNMDPPRHTRVRGLVTRKLTPKYVERFRPDIQRITDELLDTIAAADQPVDLVEQFVAPLTSRGVCVVLGMPRVDHRRVRDWARPLLAISREQAADAQRAAGQLAGHVFGLLRNEREVPQDGLVGSLLADPAVDDQEMFNLVAFLLISGHITTSVQLTNSILELLRDQGQLDRIRNDPAIVPTAVEELLRFTSPEANGQRPRIATRDVQLAGVTVRVGDLVVPVTSRANRDPSVFPDPDQLDVGRTRCPHLSFGPGRHHCVGSQLARMELQTAIGGLVRRFPNLRLAIAESELRQRVGEQFREFVALPVRW